MADKDGKNVIKDRNEKEIIEKEISEKENIDKEDKPEKHSKRGMCSSTASSHEKLQRKSLRRLLLRWPTNRTMRVFTRERKHYWKS